MTPPTDTQGGAQTYSAFLFVGKDVDKMWSDIYRAIAEVTVNS